MPAYWLSVGESSLLMDTWGRIIYFVHIFLSSFLKSVSKSCMIAIVNVVIAESIVRLRKEVEK